MLALIDERSQIFSVMIWAQNNDHPFHRASNPVSINLLHIILFHKVHFVDGLRQRCESLLLHLSIFQLSVFSIEPIELFVMSLQIICEVVNILHFDSSVHFLGFH